MPRPLASTAPNTPSLLELRLRGLSRVLLAGVFALLLLSILAFGSTDEWAIATFRFASALLLCIWIYRQWISPEFVVQSNPLFAPMLGLAALTAVQLILRRTAYPKQTFSDALLYLSYAILCFLAVQVVRRGSHIRKLAFVFTAFGVVLSIFAVIQGITSPNKVYWTWTPEFGGWIYGPYVNHNHYAGLMELLVPIPLVASLTGMLEGRDKVISAAAAALMASTIFLSGSRGGMLALMVQLGVLGGILAHHRRGTRNSLILGAFLVILFGCIAWVGGGEIADRLGTIGEETRQEISGGMRLGIDKDGLRMFTHRPLLGWGLGTFPVVYPEYRSFSTTFFINEAHNDYIQLLVEMGAIGFGLMFWFLVRFYRSTGAKLENWHSSSNGAMALAAILGVTGILVHSFLDFNLQVPANAAMFYVLAVLGAAHPVGESVRRKKSSSHLIEEVWAAPA